MDISMEPETAAGKRLEAGAIIRNAQRDLERAQTMLADAAYLEGRRVLAIQTAAEHALDYLRNALSEDFARGSDREVREELAAALGIDLNA